MKRRTFLQSLAAIFGIAAVVPSVTAGSLRPEIEAVEEGFTRVPGYRPVSLVVRHHAGVAPCGGIAYRLKRLPDFGGLIRSADFTLPDGSPVMPNSLLACHTCGARMERLRRSDIEDEARPGVALFGNARG